VGRLKRGQTVSHEVELGTHDVKALFAKTGWQVPDPKTSPTMTYTAQDGETLVLNVSLGPANSPGMTAPTEEDWLSLTAAGESGSNQAAQRSNSAIARGLLAVIALGSFMLARVFHPGSAGAPSARSSGVPQPPPSRTCSTDTFDKRHNQPTGRGGPCAPAKLCRVGVERRRRRGRRLRRHDVSLPSPS